MCLTDIDAREVLDAVERRLALHPTGSTESHPHRV
jgi:hypothetical protein